MNNDRIYYSHEAEMQAMHDMTKITLGYLAIGVGAGAILALFLAVSSNKQARHDLNKTVNEGLNKGRHAAEPMVKSLEKEVKELRETFEKRVREL